MFCLKKTDDFLADKDILNIKSQNSRAQRDSKKQGNIKNEIVQFC
jgi:hypothetical protein